MYNTPDFFLKGPQLKKSKQQIAEIPESLDTPGTDYLLAYYRQLFALAKKSRLAGKSDEDIIAGLKTQEAKTRYLQVTSPLDKVRNSQKPLSKAELDDRLGKAELDEKAVRKWEEGEISAAKLRYRFPVWEF